MILHTCRGLILTAALAAPGLASDPPGARTGVAGKVTFDWFGNAPPARSRAPAGGPLTRVVLGRGWICSPAGGGRRSTCRGN